MLLGFNFSKLVFLPSLTFTCSIASNLTFFNTRDLCRTTNQTDSDVTFSRSSDQRKITKKIER